MISYELYTKKELIERLILLEKTLLELTINKRHEDCLSESRAFLNAYRKMKAEEDEEDENENSETNPFSEWSLRDLQYEFNRRQSVYLEKLEELSNGK
jgi:hypothetical protein